MNGSQLNKQESGQAAGLFLVRNPAVKGHPAIEELRPAQGAVREATTGRVVAMLPQVWAVAAPEAEEEPPAAQSVGMQAAPVPELAFYRKYTEAMLRRYMRLSMEAGRVPSLLGRELFRGRVTSYRVKSFEDVVIFCHDIETCLCKLRPLERELVKRITLQEYAQGEAAAMLGMSFRSCRRRYREAIDHMTSILLELRLMEPLKTCQGGSVNSDQIND